MQSNPVARWHICLGSINSIAFSNDGSHLATVGRDGKTHVFHSLCSSSSFFSKCFLTKSLKLSYHFTGYLRVFDFSTQKLVCGGKSYYGALLCCSWRCLETYP